MIISIEYLKDISALKGTVLKEKAYDKGTWQSVWGNLPRVRDV